MIGWRAADSPDARARLAFDVKSANVDVRAGDPDALVVLGGVPEDEADTLRALCAQDLAPYVDAVGVTTDAPDSAVDRVVAELDPSAAVVTLGKPLGDGPDVAARALLASQSRTIGTRTRLVTYRVEPRVMPALMPVLASLGDLLSQPVVPLDEPRTTLRFRRGGRDVTAATPHRLLFGLRSLTNYLVYDADGSGLSVEVTDRSGAQPLVVDALAGTRAALPGWKHDDSVALMTAPLPSPGYPLVIDWNRGGRDSFVEQSEVTTAAMPALAEIISRHQQVQAAQDEAVTSYIAHGHLEQHFRATAADLAFDVVTENTFFVEGASVEFEELEFRLNGTRWGADRPPFPLLQAEKVLSLPLDLRLTSDYTYRLSGIDRIDGREAFAIRFDPRDDGRSLYRGTVWIDRATYRRVKVQTVQTALEAPLLSSEEIQFFSEVQVPGGPPAMLMTRVIGRQSMLIAGRNLLLEREMQLGDFAVNAPDFADRRARARDGDHIMFRDTDEGLRYLVKRDGQRVVETETTTKAKALLLGVTFDPAYDFPLPLGGLNYLNFDFMGKGNQLALIYGGVLALGNLQRANLIGHSVDGSVDLFAIAVPGSDRQYTVSGERPETRVLNIPFSTGATVGWRLAEFTRLVGSYQFRYDWYGHDRTTADTYVTPGSTITNGLGVSWEWKRRANSVTASWTGYRRASWRAWGEPGDFDPRHRDYAKYSLSASKAYFTGLHKVTLNAAYFGGRDLDRFSKYQFGFFDENRIRGVPSAGVRFAELGMFRGAYSFNVFDIYRLDLFLDQAVGRDRAVAPGWRPVTGVGVAFSLRGPRNTMVRGDIGKSFLPREYRRPGSFVFQFQVLKPL
ncbi:MAG: sigma-E factor regulatory protein RseB domain-containing protein [Vicinamibacterales bacterium]